MAAISGLDADEVNPVLNQVPDDEGNLVKDSAALSQLMVNLNRKIDEDSLSHADKVQILTLAPAFWTAEKTVNFFCVSRYSVLQARQLVQLHGVLARPKPRKQRTGIPEEVKQTM